MPRGLSLWDEGYGKIGSSSVKWPDPLPGPPLGRFWGDNTTEGSATPLQHDRRGNENASYTAKTKMKTRRKPHSHADRSADLWPFWIGVQPWDLPRTDDLDWSFNLT